MASVRAHGQLVLQNENLDIHHNGSLFDGKTGSSKTTKKKGGGGRGNRKALNDITNSSSLHQEAAPKKKNNLKEFNIAEEMFLHDHRKCIQAQTTSMDRYPLDTVLEDDFISPALSPKPKQAKADFESPPMYLELELVPELPMSPFPAWLESPTQWDSPPPSPFRFEPQSPNFVLKPDIDDPIDYM